MLLNVDAYRFGKETGAEVPSGEALTKLGGGNVVMDCLDKVDPAALLRVQIQLSGRVQVEAGSAYDDPLRELEEACGLVPARDVEEGVGSDNGEEFGFGTLLVKHAERINGVVRTIVAPRRIES